jgi:predicted regulator of Ras-like GTPase activity (Roadblock/LC7/MglB family)
MSNGATTLHDVLANLRSRVKDVILASLVNREGLIIAAEPAESQDIETLGALSADIILTANAIGRLLAQGTLEGSFFSCARGIVFMFGVNEEVVLTLLAKRGTRVGLLMVHAKDAVSKLAVLMKD